MIKKLIRQRDGIEQVGKIKFVEFDGAGRGKTLHEKPQVGYACMVGSYPIGEDTWLTSEIVEVISDEEFKTRNSHYKIEEI